ncbi:hypothetical protein ISN45_Aa01g020850 [Arabidopsis thaliana x Arabidopsis arenosa]|uniref:Uncharacterized protein n=1 Tax=Arabidopsis thaliana x Arabidopsis arenosa TaxID=1240361 RepID=A0A8T2C4V1_9BRAS|nr:hypothetical protein ISN45_Aa01g020850 [Arabidopsis thaliana x Arabidopsis arenosa]
MISTHAFLNLKQSDTLEITRIKQFLENVKLSSLEPQEQYKPEYTTSYEKNAHLDEIFMNICFLICLDAEHKRSIKSTKKIMKFGENIHSSHTKPREKTDHDLGLRFESYDQFCKTDPERYKPTSSQL